MKLGILWVQAVSTSATVASMATDGTTGGNPLADTFFGRVGNVIKDVLDDVTDVVDTTDRAAGGIGNAIGGLGRDVLEDVFGGKAAPKPAAEITHVRSDATVNDFLRHALEQVGDRHQKGAEAKLSDADPDAWDSSELVEWSANVSGVMVNDGSWHQYRQLNREGGGMSVDDALHTPGALVFTFSSDPMASRDRPTSAGVAISLGNGQVITVTPGGTVEVVDASTREFTHGAVMPGFEDARGQTPEAREQLEQLLEAHGLESPHAPEPDFFDPDGDGVPMSPADATARIEELQQEAARLRDQAEHAEEYNDRRDADLEVANALLEEREADLERQKDASARAARAEAEAAADLYRASPDLKAANDEVVALQHRLGIPVPSERDLLTPDGDPQPPPPPPETDPATVQQLRGELVFAQAHVDQLTDDNRPLHDVLDRMTAERKDADALRTAAEAAVAEQRADVAEISGPREYANADEFLAVARKVEAEAQELADRADDIAERFEQHQAEHPERPATDLGEIEVKVSGAEAFAQGRRERAAELEDEAADLEAQSIDDERAAIERSELSDLRDERADDLRRRAEEATTRATDAQRLASEAAEQAQEWAATADKRLADATRLDTQGRTEDAEMMRGRAERATQASVEQGFRVGELRHDAEAFTAQAVAFNAEATSLSHEADLLDDEAATLTAAAKDADVAADKLQARAVVQDSLADEVDARLASGVATELHIKDDAEGIDVVIEIPGRQPTEDDLSQPRQPVDGNDSPTSPDQQPAPSAPSAPTSQVEHQSPVDDADVAEQQVAMVEPSFAAPAFEAPPEPEQDFAAAPPEPDMTDELFDGLGGDDGFST